MGENLKKIINNGKIEKVDNFIEDKDGKIIYEVLRIIEGKPLFIEKHYERMENSFKLSGLELSISYDELRNQIDKLVKSNNIKEGNIKITYSVLLDSLKIFFIKHSYPTKQMYDEGVKTILFFGERENPNAKIVNNDFRSRVNESINSRGAYEAILVNRDGLVTEGSKSNIFIIKDGVVYTSRVKDVLPGVTRMEIIEMAKEMGVEIVETDYNYLDIENADAMFISGTSPNILPISYVEEKKLDVKNDILISLMRSFKEKISNYIKKLK